VVGFRQRRAGREVSVRVDDRAVRARKTQLSRRGEVVRALHRDGLLLLVGKSQASPAARVTVPEAVSEKCETRGELACADAAPTASATADRAGRSRFHIADLLDRCSAAAGVRGRGAEQRHSSTPHESTKPSPETGLERREKVDGRRHGADEKEAQECCLRVSPSTAHAPAAVVGTGLQALAHLSPQMRWPMPQPRGIVLGQERAAPARATPTPTVGPGLRVGTHYVPHVACGVTLQREGGLKPA
jgi:hypothetical protein